MKLKNNFVINAAILIITLWVSIPAMASTYNPDAAQTNAQLGLAYLAKGMYPASKDRLLTALHEDPEIPVVWYSMAYYLEKTNNLKAAARYYRHAIAIAPQSGSAKNNYGTFLCRHGHYQAAIQAFMSAIDQPDYLYVAKAYENAGECAMMIPNNRLAMHFFIKALNNDPILPNALLNIARLSHIRGNDAAAKRYFKTLEKTALQNKSKNVIKHYWHYVFSSPRVKELPLPGMG